MAADRTEWRKNWCQRDALFGRTSLTEQQKDLSGILLTEWCQNLLICAIFGLRDNNRQKCLSLFTWDVFVWVNNAAFVKTMDDRQRRTRLIQIALPCGSVLRLHAAVFSLQCQGYSNVFYPKRLVKTQKNISCMEISSYWKHFSSLTTGTVCLIISILIAPQSFKGIIVVIDKLQGHS